MTLNDTLSKGAIALACAALTWLGASVVRSASDNTRQDEQIAAMKNRETARDAALEKLTDAVQALDKNVAVLNERLKDYNGRQPTRD